MRVVLCVARHVVDSCSVCCLLVDRLIECNHVRDLLKIEWNQQGLQQLAQEASRQAAATAQGVYDRVLSMGAGKSPQEVKTFLPESGNLSLERYRLTQISQMSQVSWPQGTASKFESDLRLGFRPERETPHRCLAVPRTLFALANL
jgi:hypothetical protein